MLSARLAALLAARPAAPAGAVRVQVPHRRARVVQHPGPAQLAAKLSERGKGSIELTHQLYCGDSLCLEAIGRYAVLPNA